MPKSKLLRIFLDKPSLLYSDIYDVLISKSSSTVLDLADDLFINWKEVIIHAVVEEIIKKRDARRGFRDTKDRHHVKDNSAEISAEISEVYNAVKFINTVYDSEVSSSQNASYYNKDNVSQSRNVEDMHIESYANTPSVTAPYANAPYATAPYATAPYANAPYATAPYATTSFQQLAYSHNDPYLNSRQIPYYSLPSEQSVSRPTDPRLSQVNTTTDVVIPLPMSTNTIVQTRTAEAQTAAKRTPATRKPEAPPVQTRKPTPAAAPEARTPTPAAAAAATKIENEFELYNSIPPARPVDIDKYYEGQPVKPFKTSAPWFFCLDNMYANDRFLHNYNVIDNIAYPIKWFKKKFNNCVYYNFSDKYPDIWHKPEKDGSWTHYIINIKKVDYHHNTQIQKITRQELYDLCFSHY